MKKLILPLLLFFTISVSAQELWFDAGLKGAWGPTLLFNKNAMDEAYLNQKLNTGFGYGAKFAINFGYIHGFTFDFMLNNGHQQYDVTETGYQPVDIKWKTYDIYALYRLYRTINYLEIGPKFSSVSSFRNNDVDTKQFYVSNYPSAVLGFGWYVFGNKSFTGTLGIRIEYAFNDIISQEGKEVGYPVNPFRTEPYDTYATTNPLIAQLSFELNWGLGYFAKTACGERRHFFSF
ncbi:MAG TPA: hypothetical protein ENK91_01710 [Bacteroidetes bacterium]|nr:hypothetical protein [Bacteroidota bacterium]